MKLNINYNLVQEIREEETFRTPKNLFLKIVIFAVVFFVSAMAESIGMMIRFMPKLFEWAATQGNVSSDELMEKLNTMLLDPSYTNIMLYSTVIATLVTLFYCRVIEGRRLSTMGFHKKGALVKYLIGLGVGFVLFSLVVLLAMAMGGLTWNGFKGGAASSIAVVLFGFLLQGMSEEVIFRGCFMTTILRHHNIWWAIGLNAVGFSMAHFSNNGISVLAAVNLALYAVMISLYMLRTNDIWGACAIHGIWNFVQGNFYGLPVSGIDSGATIFSMSLVEGKQLLNGGDFGLEGSIAATIVLAAASALLLLLPSRTKDAEETAA